jgi:hypothetical protein
MWIETSEEALLFDVLDHVKKNELAISPPD